MNWRVLQTRRFSRSYKKLHGNVALVVDQAIADIEHNPDLGDKKRGDLADMWVYKFQACGQLYLLAYSRDEVIRLIYLEAIGTHENFYRDLKR